MQTNKMSSKPLFTNFQIKTSAAVIASQSRTAARLMTEVSRRDDDVISFTNTHIHFSILWAIRSLHSFGLLVWTEISVQSAGSHVWSLRLWKEFPLTSATRKYVLQPFLCVWILFCHQSLFLVCVYPLAPKAAHLAQPISPTEEC